MKKKEIKIIIYFILVLLLILGIIYFVQNIGPKLLLDWVIWLGEDAI